jgi:6-phospho-beta-glucosidase
VIEIMEAIVDNRNEVHVVNSRNDGAIPNLPDDAVVEVLAQVNGHGVQPLRTVPLPDALAGLLRGYVSLQKQMVKAALSGSRLDLLHTLLLDPMSQAHLDLEQTEAMMDEMLAVNARFLPRFNGAA